MRSTVITRTSEWRRSKSLVLTVVTVAIWLDSLQSSVISPMLPDFLESLQNASGTDTDIATHNRPSTRNATIVANTTTTAEHSLSVTSQIGLLLASKMFFEFIMSPIYGKMGDKFGCTVPMMIGFFITFASTIVFAFAETYGQLFIARSIHGFGAAAVNAPGIGLLASTFPDEKQRAAAMALSYGGAVFGIVVGPVFGGVMYYFYGKTVTFLILAAVTLVDGCLRALIIDVKGTKKEEKGSSFSELLADPHIQLVLGALFIGSLAITGLGVVMPVYVKHTLGVNSAGQGLLSLPITVAVLVTWNSLASFSLRVGRYRMSTIGLVIMSVGFMLFPESTTLYSIIGVSILLGIGIGMLESALYPELGHLVDLRHKPSYGTIYGLTQSSFCLAYVVGASACGILVSGIGLSPTFTIFAVLCLMYSILPCCVRAPGTKLEESPLIIAR